MSDVAPPHLSRTELLGNELRPEEVARIVDAVVAGGQWVRSITRINSTAASVVFPIISDVSDPAWVPEMGLIPTLNIEGQALTVTPATVAGTTLVPNQLIDDLARSAENETVAAIQSKFSYKLDADLLMGAGTPAPTPSGVLPPAPAVAGPDLWRATIRAKSQIAAEGGSPSHVVMSPETAAAEEERIDQDGRPLYEDGLATFAGLQVVLVAAATEPMVYDRTKVFLVVRKDFSAMRSLEYAPAWERNATALKLDGRFAAAVPSPRQAVRRLEVGDEDGRRAGQPERERTAPPRSA